MLLSIPAGFDEWVARLNRGAQPPSRLLQPAASKKHAKAGHSPCYFQEACQSLSEVGMTDAYCKPHANLAAHPLAVNGSDHPGGGVDGGSRLGLVNGWCGAIPPLPHNFFEIARSKIISLSNAPHVLKGPN